MSQDWLKIWINHGSKNFLANPIFPWKILGGIFQFHFNVWGKQAYFEIILYTKKSVGELQLYILIWALISPSPPRFFSEMATLLRAPFTAPPPQSLISISTRTPKAFHLSFSRRCPRLTPSLRFSPILRTRFLRFDSFASNGEATETQEVHDPEIEVNGLNISSFSFINSKPFIQIVGWVRIFGMLGWWVSVGKRESSLDWD